MIKPIMSLAGLAILLVIDVHNGLELFDLWAFVLWPVATERIKK